MATLSIPNSFSPNTVIQSSQVNANFSAIATEYNAHAVQTDVAKTITVSHTFSVSQTFSSGISVTGNIVMASAVSQIIPGATAFSIRDTANANDNLIITNAGAVQVRAGLTVASGTTALFGPMTFDSITRTITWGSGPTGYALRSGGSPTAFELIAADASDYALFRAKTLYASAGGLQATGNSLITGNLTVTGTFSAPGVVTATALAVTASSTSVTPANTAMAVVLGANQTWRVEFDLGVNCNNTGGVVLNFTVPAGATGRVVWIGNTSSATAVYAQTANSFVSVSTWSSFNSTGLGDGVTVRACCYVSTGATPGNLTLQLAAGVAAQTCQVLAGSTMLATRIS